MQASPLLRIFAGIAAATATSMDAEGMSRNGALPPSSIEVRKTPSAACLSRTRPTSVEPVNVSLRNRRSGRSASDTDFDFELVITLTTPSGSPASDSACMNMRVVSGVADAGLSTTVQPAASAGATLRVPIASGKFQGVIARTGPTGFFIVRTRFPVDGAWLVRPKTRTASSANQRKNSAP